MAVIEDIVAVKRESFTAKEISLKCGALIMLSSHNSIIMLAIRRTKKKIRISAVPHIM